MKKFFKLTLCVTLLSIMAVSCIQPQEGDDEYEIITSGAFVLNEGNNKSNDSNICFYSIPDKKTTPNAFELANNVQLGDLGQSMLGVGTVFFIGMCNSSVIWVTDVYLNLVTKYTPTNNYSPRHMVTDDTYLYVSYFEGYVGVINPQTFDEKLIEVGPNPEQMVIVNNKLYVANSGGLNYESGYNNTVSVIDLKTLKVTKELLVTTNPCLMLKDSKGDIYLISKGNYADIPATFQKINSSTDEVTVITEVKNPAMMAIDNKDMIYMVNSYYDENWTLHAEYTTYDAATETPGGSFIKDGTAITSPYSITVDSYGGYIFVGESDYVSTGTMYVFSKDGKLYDKFDTGGLNPHGATFIYELQ